MQKNIFDVAGMKDSYLVDQETIHPFEARGYTMRQGKLVNIQRFWDSEIPSNSGIYSNVRDLSKWDSILNTEQLLSSASKKIMWKNTQLNNGTFTGYGLGWYTNTFGNKLTVSHKGITGTEMTKYVNDSLTIIVLTNLGAGYNTDKSVNSWGMSPHIGGMLRTGTNWVDSTYITNSGHKVIKFSERQMKKVVGTYMYDNKYEKDDRGTPRKITIKNGKLYYDKGNWSCYILPLDNGDFIVEGVASENIIKVKSKDYSQLEWEQITGTLIRVDD